MILLITFALFADYIADLLRIDGDLNDLRSILADGLFGSEITGAITSSRM